MCRFGPNQRFRSTLCGHLMDLLHRFAPISDGEGAGRGASRWAFRQRWKLGATRADLHPRPMRRSRPNQCCRSTAVGPGTDRLRYPGRGCTIGASVRPSSLSSFTRGARPEKGHSRVHRPNRRKLAEPNDPVPAQGRIYVY